VVQTVLRAGAPRPTVRAVELITSELVTNAVRYGPPDGWVLVSAASDGSELRLAVTDGGATIPSKREPNRTGGGGFGLHLVERLASDWGVEPLTDRAGKTVWVRMPHEGPEGGAFSRTEAVGD
jgi:two-component sensor histidine kinase